MYIWLDMVGGTLFGIEYTAAGLMHMVYNTFWETMVAVELSVTASSRGCQFKKSALDSTAICV